MKFLDGPAEGIVMSVRRAPRWLRVVRNREDGSWDCLNELEDKPRLREDVFVYRLVPGTWFSAHVRPGGCKQFGDYRHVPDAPTEKLRGTAAWRAWTTEQEAES